ncbi:MAG: DsbA family protein [Rhodobacteraceae bacterium]|nr:DsbA family protein [Paracoccaceae bacterium]
MTNSNDLDRRAVLALVAGATLAGSMAYAQDATPSDDDMSAPVVEEFSMGNPDAAVTVIEYASFTCPHCKNFHHDVFPDLKANYIDTGKILFIYRPVYFDGPGLWADMVARCGGQERYFGIASMLYERQSDWAHLSSQADVSAALQAIGRLAGLEDDAIIACMQDNELAQALVGAFRENMARDNVQATPTFIINGELNSNMGYATFAQILDEKLAE